MSLYLCLSFDIIELKCAYEMNHQCKYAKYDPFIITDVVYQVFYIQCKR